MQIKEELKNSFTSYWSFMTLRTACQLNLFDAVKSENYSVNELNKKLKTDLKSLTTLINALIELKTLKIIDNKLRLSSKGELLTNDNPDSLKQACILWGEEHLDAWKNLSYTIKTGTPSFEKVYGTSFFNYLASDKNKLYNYHKAMAEYAVDDYKNITDVFNFSEFSSITDVGGGLGILIKYIYNTYPDKIFNLVELPEVIALIEDDKKVNLYSTDFFKSIPIQSDLIILSRVLHDWNDEKAKIILENCLQSLSENGKILIIEILQEDINANLLSLNMLTICESFERTSIEYRNLIEKVGLTITKKVKLNNLQTILTLEKQ